MRSGIIKLLKGLGPGVITGASDDDPSGIATYSQAGAQFGLSTLWAALISTPLMAAIQEMCAKIGVVTHKGLTGVVKEHYPKIMLYTILLISVPAVVLNIGADISAVGAVSNLLMPQLPASFFSLVFTVVLPIGLIKFSYRRISSLLKWLCLALCSYIITPFLISQNWPQVIVSGILPTIKPDKYFILILVAIFGTTISPYLFFWQASSEVEEMSHRHRHLIAN